MVWFIIGHLFATLLTWVRLGLPIAKKIIDKHGGSIEVTSIPGKGSTITIAIPLYTSE